MNLSDKTGPVVVQGLNVPGGGETAIAIGWTNAASPESVVEILCTTQHGVVDGVGCAALDLSGIAKLRAALDKAEAAYHERMGTSAPRSELDVAKALLKRTIPAL